MVTADLNNSICFTYKLARNKAEKTKFVEILDFSVTTSTNKIDTPSSGLTDV